jgi:chitin synthase
LGEDRYLTTLILKHFPSKPDHVLDDTVIEYFTDYKTKFTPDAQALTSAPASWGILLSQRRRWINSTVHNLAELVFLPDLCGFCCKYMLSPTIHYLIVCSRFLNAFRGLHRSSWYTHPSRYIWIFGQHGDSWSVTLLTLSLQLFLLIEVGLGKEAIPVIALAMLAAVYGLQAIIFLLKRQWQYVCLRGILSTH